MTATSDYVGRETSRQTGPDHSVPAARPAGMPPLPADYPRIPAFKKYLSEKVFYAPMALVWLALSARYGSVTLPTAANPNMDAGGLWGESKIQCMSIAGPTAMAWTAPFIWFRNGGNTPAERKETFHHAVTLMKDADLSFPIVAKPDIGYQSWGVRRIDTPIALRSYLADYPPDQHLMLQALVPYDGEAGIFYIRRPGDARGQIHSMALVYYPHVIGDGVTTLEGLIDGDAWISKAGDEIKAANAKRLDMVPESGETVRLTFCGSYRLGAVYRDACSHITEALTNRIEEISRDIPGFHFGRFDIRFRSLDALKRGEDFRIVEVNGGGAEVLHIWDGKTTLGQAYRALWTQYRHLFRIAADNRALGHKPVGLAGMFRRQRKQEKLRAAYPHAN